MISSDAPRPELEKFLLEHCHEEFFPLQSEKDKPVIKLVVGMGK